ncbi:MAG: universal stress protein [Deltaproteobacteria bacterium]|nr:universal stress protein [Deltaproteobacteria bacterium]
MNIIVGLDRSEISKAVLMRAVLFAKRNDGKLHIVRAVPIPVEMPLEALSIDPEALPARLLDYAQRDIERMVDDAPKDVVASVEARVGVPWQVLVDVAREKHAELLIVGTHQYGILDRLLGTTAARVANHAPCSVYIVREITEEKK